MPKRRHMARDRRAYPVSLSHELASGSLVQWPSASKFDRTPLALPFHNGVPPGSPSLLCPSPEPEANPPPITRAAAAIGKAVILKRPARGNGLVSRTVGFGSPPLLNAEADPLGVFVAGSQRAHA
jgi:hypothetical protein